MKKFYNKNNKKRYINININSEVLCLKISDFKFRTKTQTKSSVFYYLLAKINVSSNSKRAAAINIHLASNVIFEKFKFF